MALKSMTGFAREQGAAGGYAWVVELRSVNGRGLDLRIRAQAPFDSLEADMRARAQKVLSRGNVNLTLTSKRDTTVTKTRINEVLFAELAETAERLTWSAKLATVTIGDLLALPGVVESGDAASDAPDETVTAAVLATFDGALAALVASRRNEGVALEKVLGGHLDAIAAAVVSAEATDVIRLESIMQRLNTQVRALLDAADGLDPQRLHQEAALIASRVDIREEIDRLKAHLDTARTLLKAKEPVGRKLDFLTQEFAREANTLCSKANDIALTRVGLDLKSWVEQFREQVQNIE